MSFLVSRSSGTGAGVSRSASSPAVKRTLSGMEKDLSEGTSTSHTASETEFNDASEVMGASDHTLGFNNTKGDGLDASRHGMEDSSTKKQGPPSKRGSGMMRGMWSSMRSFRTNTRRASLESKDGNAGMDESLHNGSVHGAAATGASGSVHSPKLPKRQATFETARGSTVGGDAAADQMSLAGSFANLEIDCGDLTIEEGAAVGGANEETVELQEKIEALERKLETKQAVLQSLLPSADSENDEDRLKLKIQEQALRIEALEEEQYRRDSIMEEEQEQQQQMDLLQQQSSQSSVQYWEQIQEQQETITRMESDHQYQMQMFTKREKQLQEMLAQAQAEKQKMQESHEQQLHELQSQLKQTQNDAEGYRVQANDLREMVNDMEQTNEEQIHLLRIAMSSIEDSLGEQF